MGAQRVDKKCLMYESTSDNTNGNVCLLIGKRYFLFDKQ